MDFNGTDKIITELLKASEYGLEEPFTFKIPKEKEKFLYYWQGCGSNIITWLDKGIPKGSSIRFIEMKKYLDDGIYIKKMTNKKYFDWNMPSPCSFRS